MYDYPQGYPSSGSDAFTLLQSHPKLSIDDMKILALIEQSGEGFYMAIAKAANNPEASSLLERNGHEERGHAHRIVKALGLLGVKFSLPEIEKNPYHGALHFDAIDGAFLSMLQQTEIGGDHTYNIWADNEPNADVAKILRQNGSEETRHGERVAKAQALLSAATH